MPLRYFLKHRHVILYGLSLALLMFLLKWLELRFIIVNHAFELYIGAIAVIFTGLGIWLALKLASPKIRTVVIEKQVDVSGDFILNEDEIQRLGLSKRELEVLELIAGGHTNQEIAEKLFVSLNTVKSHSSRIFEKMEVTSRTKAVEKAKRLLIIP